MKNTTLYWICFAVVLLSSGRPACCQTNGPPESPVTGQFVSIVHPIDDAMVSEVVDASLKLQSKADRDSKDAVLILEIQPGTSSVGSVIDLAKRLTSDEFSRIRTVAWIPKSLDGLPVVLALACDDIIMSPTAEMGSFVTSQEYSEEELQLFAAISRRAANSLVPEAVIEVMMDSSKVLYRVKMDSGSGQSETRFLTEDALRSLQSGGATIQETEIMKDRGTELVLTGETAFSNGLVVKATAKDRAGLMKLFRLSPQSMQRSASTLSDGVPVVMIDLNKEFSPTLADYATREMQRAVSGGARYVIFRVNSTGGDAESAQGLAVSISQLSADKATTIAWVPGNAYGNAAIVALACDRIFIGEAAGIGDIESALTSGGTKLPQEQGAAIRRLEALMGDIAKQKGRSPALMRAMVNSELQVFSASHKASGETAWMTNEELIAVPDQWVTGDVVPETNVGKPMLLTADRAIALSIAEAKCRDEGELRLKLGLTARTPISVVSNTWVDGLVFFLNSGVGAFLLISAGFLALYFEAHFPSGIFTIISITCFSMFFWSRFLGGTAGTLELILFLLGVGLLAVEFFVIPGFGVFGISGIVLMCVSLVMASYTFAGMTAGESFETSLKGLGTLSAALVTVILVAIIMNQFLPQIPFVKNLILTPPGYAAPETGSVILNPNLLKSTTQTGPVTPGEVGIAASVLRPSGKAAFGDKFLDVVSDGGFIEHGARIEVLRVAGNRIVVRPINQ
ncbi:MAG: hypothetical protein JNL58_13685 [Planctomyces sp.]|nr:hypothetical protein [Planctomyces sp.]